MRSDAITVEPDGSHDSGPCECCGNQTRSVWGCLSVGRISRAAYFVWWTPGRIDHGAIFELIVGEWGEQSTSNDRFVIAVELRSTPDGPQFMVIDATDRLTAERKVLAHTTLRRDQVIGTPLASEVFAMLDAIWLNEKRISELTRLA